MPGPLSDADTLQAGACLFLPFQISRDHMIRNKPITAADTFFGPEQGRGKKRIPPVPTFG